MSAESSEATELRCANHPGTVTHLRCSRCGKPICVRCVIQTPVGGRCRECAQLRKDPILVVGPRLYLRAAAYGLTASILFGVLWAQVGRFGLGWLLLMLVGYGVGEAVSRGASGKISRGLVAMAGGLTVLSVVVGRAALLISRMPPGIPWEARLGAGLEYGLGSLLADAIGLLLLALAVVIAASRVK